MIQNAVESTPITEGWWCSSVDNQLPPARVSRSNLHGVNGSPESDAQAVRDRCPGCDAVVGPAVYSVAATPITVATVFATAAQARAVPLARVDLVLCQRCGLLFNPWFQSALAEVGARYESSQASSAHFSSFALTLARAWIERHALIGKSVLEIGCARGEFLQLMLSEGVGSARGLDPVAPAEGIDAPGLTVEARSFDADTVDRDADAIVCRHTLEHIRDVRAFLDLLLQWASRKAGRVVLFEVPAAERILTEAAFWDVYYEHCNYFTAASLQWAFESAGFEVLRVDRVYGDQYLIIEAQAARTTEPVRPDFSSLSQECQSFGSVAREAIGRCNRNLERLAASGRPTVLWQGAAKTVGFLSSLECSDLVHSAVDLSPQRHGHYLPGTGLPVHPPQALRAIDPGHVVLMNPVYLDEVRAQLSSMGATAVLLTVNDLCGLATSVPQSRTK